MPPWIVSKDRVSLSGISRPGENRDKISAPIWAAGVSAGISRGGWFSGQTYPPSDSRINLKASRKGPLSWRSTHWNFRLKAPKPRMPVTCQKRPAPLSTLGTGGAVLERSRAANMASPRAVSVKPFLNTATGSMTTRMGVFPTVVCGQTMQPKSAL